MSNAQKVAIITGASQGIGASLVKAYRDRNYRVVATSRSLKQGSDPDVVAVDGDIGDRPLAQQTPIRHVEHRSRKRRHAPNRVREVDRALLLHV